MTDLRVRLTGGQDSLVVCAHPDLCHHCGYLAGGPLQTCADCGVRAHAECVLFHEGRCDACRHGLTAADVCEVCQIADDDAPAHDVDRLIRVVVFHGRTWEEVTEQEQEQAVVEHAQLAARILDGRCSPADLPPERGGAPFRARASDGRVYRSRPLVVHSWCAQCAFQVTIPPPCTPRDVEMHPAWTTLVEHLDAPRRGASAETRTAHAIGVVNAESACVFCASSAGVQVFCHGHTSGRTGCTTCRWSVRPHLTYYSFHPSCAVRAGMHRVVDLAGAGSGMLCHHSLRNVLPRVHGGGARRTITTAPVERWLSGCSGLHLGLAERRPPLMQRVDLSHLATKKSLYDAFPMEASARRGTKRNLVVVPRAERLAQNEENRGVDVEAAGDARGENETDARHDDADHPGQDGADAGEAGNGAHSSMTRDEARSRLHTLIGGEGLEALDTYIVFRAKEYAQVAIAAHVTEERRRRGMAMLDALDDEA